MKKLFSLAMILALSACAIAKQTYGPDGRAAQSISCSGGALTWGACYEKAGDICGKAGYTVIQQIGEGMGGAAMVNGTFFSSYSHARTLEVQCRGQ